jgi:hypothetical protein
MAPPGRPFVGFSRVESGSDDLDSKADVLKVHLGLRFDRGTASPELGIVRILSVADADGACILRRWRGAIRVIYCLTA